MKKILSCFLVCAFLCTGLYGCGSKKTELIEEAKDLTLSQEISITPEQNDYGFNQTIRGALLALKKKRKWLYLFCPSS